MQNGLKNSGFNDLGNALNQMANAKYEAIRAKHDSVNTYRQGVGLDDPNKAWYNKAWDGVWGSVSFVGGEAAQGIVEAFGGESAFEKRRRELELKAVENDRVRRTMDVLKTQNIQYHLPRQPFELIYASAKYSPGNQLHLRPGDEHPLA